MRCFFSAAFAFVSLASLLPAATSTAAGREALTALPLRFEANAGQWNRDIRFAAHAPGYQLLLTPREAVVALEGRTLGISLVNASRTPAMTGSEPLATRANYLVGPRQRWRSGVPQYGRVRYSSVYPGIDVVYYGNGRQLEYDFVLQPQADPGRIRLRFRGAERVSLNESGDLVLTSGQTSFVQKRPLVYQQDAAGKRHEIGARYRMVNRHTAAIEVAAYDRGRALTIDPVLSYSTLIGSAGADAVTAVKLDPSTGWLYVAGAVNNTDVNALLGTDGSFIGATKGSTDGFLAIFDTSLSGADSLRYFTYLGGGGIDQVNAIALDAGGNVFLAGSTNSSDFPLAGVNVNAAFAGGGSDGFLTKLNPRLAGGDALLYSTFIGGTDTDVATAVAVDRAGNVYVSGSTRSTDFPLTSSAYAPVLYGPQDAFLVKLAPDSSTPLLYSTYFGSEGTDYGRGLAAGENGIVWVGGSTDGQLLPQAGFQYQDKLKGFPDVDGFLAEFDTNKSVEQSLVYSTYLGGTSTDEITGLALDSAGKLLVTGYTLSVDFPTTGNAYNRNAASSSAAFLVRFDATVQRSADQVLYSTFFGGSGGEVAYAVAADTTGGAWITGYTLSTNMPVVGGPVQDSNPGGVDVFAARFDPSKSGAASLTFSTYLGSTGVHVGYAVAVGADGTAYLGGYTGPRNLRLTDSAWQGGFAGGVSDGFVAVVKP